MRPSTTLVRFYVFHLVGVSSLQQQWCVQMVNFWVRRKLRNVLETSRLQPLPGGAA
jgi:hypothetical protein